MKRRIVTRRPDRADYAISVVGETRRPLRDFYHALMRLSWTTTLLMIGAAYLLVNALFAVGFVATGGLANVRPGSFVEAFFFSVQTLGTIGYGSIYPVSTAANVLVVVESLFGLILTALATGLVFAKFSRPTARVVFTRYAVIFPMNGVPTMMLRISNQRGNQIVGAQIRAVLSRTEHLDDGSVFYRNLDLKLSREYALSLSRSWTVLHVIDEKSPLFGRTPDSTVTEELELQVSVLGLDDTFMQTVHASHHYFTHEILWGAKHADILTETNDGNFLLDMRNFDVTQPTKATDAFPYTWSGVAPRSVPAGK